MNGIEKRRGMPEIDISLYMEEISEFEKKIILYDEGKLSHKEYKSVAGNFGCITQREGGHVVRLRSAGGVINAERLRFIIDKSIEHDASLIHLTTAQTVQIHGLSGKQVADILSSAAEVSIFTKGAGGNNPRNVVASPLSGKNPAEAFDVLPFAEATEEYLLGMIDELNLPSKFKISFSNGADSEVNAVARDLGFVAVEDTFDVYLGGGMGNLGSRLGVKVMEGLNPDKTLFAVEAALSMFVRHGAGESRAKSRFRFLRDCLGEEQFRSEFLSEFELSQTRNGLKLDIDISRGNDSGIEYTKGIMAQKNGNYSVKVSPVAGNLSLREAESFLEVLKNSPESEIRLGSDQSIYFTNLDKEVAEDILSEYPAKSDFGSSLSCVGYPICQTGRRNSGKVLKTLLEMEKSAGLPDGALPKIAISGCGSSCTCHQLFPIGLMGTTVKTDEGNVPGFEVHIGGSVATGEEKMGSLVCKVPESSLPELFRVIGEEASVKGFDEWARTERNRLKEIVKSFERRVKTTS